MANPLAGMMSNAMNQMIGNANPMQIVQAFNQFKSNFNITPQQAKQKVEEAVNAGQITWDQVEQLKQFAQSIGLK